MSSIEMRKISNFEGFNPKLFCLEPRIWEYESEYTFNSPDFLVQARKLAQEIDGICVAIIKDSRGERVLVEPCNYAKFMKIVLFNAVETKIRSKNAVRVVLAKKGEGIWTRYQYDKWVKYRKDSLA